MASNRNVYDEYNLYETVHKIFIEPVSGSDRFLIIDRVTHTSELSLNRGDLPVGVQHRTIYGVLGLVHLIAGPYLILVIGRTKVGNISRQQIFRMDYTELMPLARSNTHLNDNQSRIEREYINMVDTILATPHFYFSYTYDLSHTIQRLHNTSPHFLTTPLYQRGDQRFIWNEHLLDNLAKGRDEIADFCLPIILGFVSITSCVLNGKSFSLCLVSRRSKQRAGTRLFTRGIDSQGFVANFVETEQIVEATVERASFVQTRGSMPFYWDQFPNLKYKPKPTIAEEENHTAAFNKHFESQTLDYGRQVLVNLVDHIGAEGKLEEFYRKLVNDSGNHNLKYEAFDFHKECSKLRYDRLNILIDRLADDLDQMSLMMTVGDGIVVSQQEGVFRTNCIDCLDRTNVVQSMLARASLTFVLRKLSILKEKQKVEDQVGLERIFKSVWSDNADMVSVQYSGTGALKTDYTRTGKRTKAGLFRDGVNSMIRYYKNNFLHGFREDAIDLWLGNYNVSSDEGLLMKSPLEGTRTFPHKYHVSPLILLVAIAMFFANLVTPTEYTTGTLLCLLFWGSMVSATLSVIFYYGREYVDSPRLCQKIRFPSV